MNKTFTWNKFLLDSEFELLNELEKSQQAMLAGKLEEDYKPSSDSIKRILEFAKSYHPVTTQTIGVLELNLN